MFAALPAWVVDGATAKLQTAPVAPAVVWLQAVLEAAFAAAGTMNAMITAAPVADGTAVRRPSFPDSSRKKRWDTDDPLSYSFPAPYPLASPRNPALDGGEQASGSCAAPTLAERAGTIRPCAPKVGLQVRSGAPPPRLKPSEGPRIGPWLVLPMDPAHGRVWARIAQKS